MNYRHVYHAGNAADVLKHAVLALLVAHLKRKPAAFAAIDTHAGPGRTDLARSVAAAKGEWRDGIGRLWAADPGEPALAPYLDAVRAENPDGTLRLYPGSPALLARWLRPQDRLVLNELHEEDAAALEGWSRADRRIHRHRRDAFELLPALLPPLERRGLVLIDPPYEQPDELDKAARSLERALARWPSGLYALWYPVKATSPLETLLDRFAARERLGIELSTSAGGPKLRGSGLLILNPPWRIEETLSPLLVRLFDRLAEPSAPVPILRYAQAATPIGQETPVPPSPQ